jgi:hypothetical protein
MHKQGVGTINDSTLHIEIPADCDWEHLCTCTLALEQLSREGLAATTLWHLPEGWCERLETSLYIPYHSLVNSKRAAFLEYGAGFTHQSNDSHVPVLRLRGLEGRGCRTTSDAIEVREVSEFVRRVVPPDIAPSQWISQLSENRARLSALRNQFLGRRAFVIGNGPSLAKTDLSLLKGELSFGSNGLFLLDQTYRFRPTVYGVEDRLFAEDRAGDINAYDSTIKLFPWDQWERLHGHAYLPLIRQYSPYPQFSADISSAVYSGWTVTYVLLQLALYMGVRQVILLGVDGTYPVVRHDEKSIVVSLGEDANHFASDYFGPGKRFHKPQPERVRISYEHAKECFRLAGGEIWNATSGGALDVFPRVDLREVLNG